MLFKISNFIELLIFINSSRFLSQIKKIEGKTIPVTGHGGPIGLRDEGSHIF
jgi:hypothetical protein